MNTASKLTLAIFALSCLAGTASAQEEIFNFAVTSEGLRQAVESTDLILADPLVSLQNSVDDDVLGQVNAGESRPSSEDGLGFGAAFELGSNQKSGVVTPFYRFRRRLTLRAVVPLIYKRTLHYHDGDAEASGLGDVALDVNYDWPLADATSRLLLSLQVKLPTGDSENMDGDHLVPLGTGSTDLVFSGSYARRIRSFGFLARANFRKNTVNSKTLIMVDNEDSAHTLTTEYDITAGSQFGLACHVSRPLTGPWTWYLGATYLWVDNGETEFTTVDNQGAPDVTGSYVNTHGMSLLDILPGISYDLGLIRPFVGLRIPVLSEYEAEIEPDDRDLGVVLQFTYNPGRMSHE